MKKSVKVLIIISSIIILLVGSVFGTYQFMRSSGKKQLEAATDVSKITMTTKKPETPKVEEKKEEPLKENQVRYKDQVYELKDQMYTFLVMGIDTRGEVKESSKVGKAGQADTLFLVVLDNEEKKVSMINIDRDTIADISILDHFGNFSHKQKEQIALSYAYGDSKEKSAKLTCDAVSELFYGMPIQGYCAINTSAIPIINDSVGGVTLTLLDDFTSVNKKLVKGSQQLLLGEQASAYIIGRQGIGDGTNADRMARQKQYMEAFIQAAKAATKKDVSTPVKIFQSVNPYMVTNITVNQVTYLAGSVLEYSFGSSQMKNLEGTMEKGELYNQFLVDQEKLYELVLEVFYEKCEN